MEGAKAYRVKANRPRLIATVTIAICVIGSLGLYSFYRDLDPEIRIRRLIETAYNAQRPGGARLWGAPFSQTIRALNTDSQLSEAQLLLLAYPESNTKQNLQSMIYLASGNWRQYVDAVDRFPVSMRRDAGVLNNLGASFLGLSDEDPSWLLKALDPFEQAAQLDAGAAEPRYNLVITYRKLRLHQAANDALQKYAFTDRSSAWYRELSAGNSPDRSELIDELRRAVENHDRPEAERLFQSDPDLLRSFAGQYG